MILAFAALGAAIGGAAAWGAGAAAALIMSAISLGWMAGTFIYSLLFAPKQHSYGPRLKDKDVQVSTYGAVIPIIYGNVRIAGNVIWMDKIKEHKKETTYGKGGGGSTVTTYWYSCSFAVAFCEGQVDTLSKIWLDTSLVYNNTADNDKITKDKSLSFTFYSGSETQEQDPTIQAIEGVHETPAYRGICYIVFKNLRISNYGNRLPNVRVLIAKRGSTYTSMFPVQQVVRQPDDDSEWPIDYWDSVVLVSPDSYWLVVYYGWWPTSGAEAAGTFFLIDAIQRQVVTTKTFYSTDPELNQLVECGGGGFLPFYYCQGMDIDELNRIYGAACEGYGKLARLDIETFTIQQWGPEDQPLGWEQENIVVSKNPSYPYLYSWYTAPNGWDVVFLHDRETLASPFDSSSYGYQFLSPEEASWPDRDSNISGGAINNNDGSLFVFWYVYSDTGPLNKKEYITRYYPDCRVDVWEITDIIKTNNFSYSIDCLVYDPETHQIILIGDSVYHESYAVLFLDGDSPTTVNTVISHLGVYTPCNSTVVQGVVDGYLYLSAGEWADLLYRINMVDYTVEELFEPTGGDWYLAGAPVYVSSKDSLYIRYRKDGSDLQEVILSRMATDTTWLSDVIEDICNRCGLSDTEINVAQLTDEIDGYLIDGAVNGVEAIRPLAAAYLFDGVELDGYLQFIKRGQSPAATISKDELAAHPDGDERPAPLKQTVMQEVELPQEIAVHYFDKDANQEVGVQLARRLVVNSENKVATTLPVVMDHNRAKQLAEIMLQWAWTSRVLFEFSLSIKYLYLAPTDVLTIQTTDATYQGMLTEMSLEGSVLKCKAVQDYETLYSSTASGTALPIPDEDIDWVGPSIWYLLDLPPLQPAEGELRGLYGVGNGYTDAWLGCSIFCQDPNTTNWSSFIDVTDRGITGVATTALGAFNHNIFDMGSTLTVRLDYSGHQLDSCTEAEIFTHYNYALVGNEIIQYQNAIENADGTWTLSKLLRGRHGTEWATSGHLAGDKFIVLDDMTTFWGSLNADYLNVALPFRGVSHGNDFSDGINKVYTPTFATLKPWSVVHPHFASSATQTTISWIRRNRYNNGWINSTDIPMSETTESYSLDFYTGATVTMTKTVGTATCTVSVASMSGITSCSIHQVSSSVGRGWGTEVVF